MKLSVLTENMAGGEFLAEHGLSYYIEHDTNILFDTGHSDVFIKNASKLGIDLEKADYSIVLSHGHWDHGNGLIHLKKRTLITHPYSFIRRYRVKDHSYLGLNQSWQELNQRFKLITTKQSYQISPKIFYLGEIPRVIDFELQHENYIDGKNNPDKVPDDSGLAILLNNGIAVISGCAHSGICNIIERAKAVTGINDVELVMGGFHLKTLNEQSIKTIEYFKYNRISRAIPSHCTELPVLAEFHKQFNTQMLKSGMQLSID
jgi:7,8-dihydropterin-6-yl-methyl-4-(beta-D-ribofuranosyl)aminobenzene 5'-phosphate synthase